MSSQSGWATVHRYRGVRREFEAPFFRDCAGRPISGILGALELLFFTVPKRCWTSYVPFVLGPGMMTRPASH